MPTGGVLCSGTANRGCFEAVNERILTILEISHNLKVFRVLLVKKTFP